MADLNNDGVVTSEELAAYGAHIKFMAQKRIACAAFAALIILTIALCTDFISTDRVKALGGIIPTAYIAFASIVGAYFGITGWMAQNGKK